MTWARFGQHVTVVCDPSRQPVPPKHDDFNKQTCAQRQTPTITIVYTNKRQEALETNKGKERKVYTDDWVDGFMFTHSSRLVSQYLVFTVRSFVRSFIHPLLGRHYVNTTLILLPCLCQSIN